MKKNRKKNSHYSFKDNQMKKLEWIEIFNWQLLSFEDFYENILIDLYRIVVLLPFLMKLILKFWFCQFWRYLWKLSVLFLRISVNSINFLNRNCFESISAYCWALQNFNLKKDFQLRLNILVCKIRLKIDRPWQHS